MFYSCWLRIDACARAADIIQQKGGGVTFEKALGWKHGVVVNYKLYSLNIA